MVQLQSIKLLILGSFLFGGLMLSACSSSKNLQDSRTDELSHTNSENDPTSVLYKIKPGDEIEILVWEQPNFNILSVVSSQGTIAIPLVGEVQVTGRTQEELKRDLVRQLSEYIKGEINLTISIRNLDNLMVSVLGMVAKPDNYPVVDQTSIFRILSTAGGPTVDADLKNVRLYKQIGPKNYLTLNLTDYLESGNMDSSSLLVEPGDIIYVSKKENVVREMSEFLRDVVVLFGIFRVFN